MYVFLAENNARGFNWQRPTAEVIDQCTVHPNCFPSVDVVRHYASLVPTYFSMMQTSASRNPPQVRFELPLFDACSDLFARSDLVNLGQADVLIIGYLNRCPHKNIERNEAFKNVGIHQEGQLLSWYKRETSSGSIVAYLGCAVSLWGDSVKQLVKVLQKLSKLKCVLYIGKVGSLHADPVPNVALATGDEAHTNHEVIRWHNVLSKAASTSPLVCKGSLVSVASSLCEDLSWFQTWADKCCWVDCETAHIAQESRVGIIDFGYLHIVSDSLNRQCADNLANEDAEHVQEQRTVVFDEIDRILDRFLDTYA
jgi:hypothetical protein